MERLILLEQLRTIHSRLGNNAEKGIIGCLIGSLMIGNENQMLKALDPFIVGVLEDAKAKEN